MMQSPPFPRGARKFVVLRLLGLPRCLDRLQRGAEEVNKQPANTAAHQHACDYREDDQQQEPGETTADAGGGLFDVTERMPAVRAGCPLVAARSRALRARSHSPSNLPPGEWQPSYPA